MSQQINLFDPRFRPQKPHFSAATLVLAAAAVTAVSVTIQVFYALHNRGLQATLAQTDKRAAELRDQTVRVSRELSGPLKSGALADELARVEEQLRLRRALLEGMQGGAAGNIEGFSPYLTALARQTMNGVWLTGVEIAGPGQHLVLQGRVVDGDLVPAYIRRLNQEPIFKGRAVSELRLAAKSEAAGAFVEFSLQIPLGKVSS